MSIFSGAKSSAKMEGELSAVFDIGSSSVGCALFYRNKTGNPKIIFSAREPVQMESETNAERFLELTLKSFDTLASKVSSAGVGAPKNMHVILSSPWYMSQTRVIKVAQETPFIFSNKMADELITKEVVLFKEEHKQREIKQIEISGLKTLLNGYPTGKPQNQKGKDLEMVIFVSAGMSSVLSKFEEVLFRHFHAKKILFSSFIMSSFAVARDLFVHHEDFILIDVGGEVTDISLIKKEVLRQSSSFPMGRNFMVRGVATEAKCTLDEAKSLLSLYKDGHADVATNAKLDPIVGKLKVEWLKNFQESLANLSNDVSIPAVIFITVDPDLADFFSDIIRNEQFNQYILTESKFQVIVLSMETLHGIADFEEKIVRDPFLIIESVYINRFLW